MPNSAPATPVADPNRGQQDYVFNRYNFQQPIIVMDRVDQNPQPVRVSTPVRAPVVDYFTAPVADQLSMATTNDSVLVHTLDTTASDEAEAIPPAEEENTPSGLRRSSRERRPVDHYQG